jgi:Putative serine esterase (DUF676)
MKISAHLLAALFLILGCASAHADPCSSMPAGSSGAPGSTFWALDPINLPTSIGGHVDLRTFIAGGGLARSPQATGIIHDGTTAALLVFASPVQADICFAADSDLVFEPYEPDFRAVVSPIQQAGNWTVPAAALMLIDGRYYAAALVKTVATPFNPAADTPSITAGQCCWTTLATSLLDQAPPVILVHGLWGDADSLSSVQQYLDGKPPWNLTHKSYVLPIQYSITQPFDGPEPAATIYSAVTSLLADLSIRHIVAGRVDIVGHSMGGLVARSYAGLATYRSPRNRGLGAFHDVVTIDTPELGSTLAPFLLANWNSTLQAPFGSTAYAVWSAACGLFSSENVESCFESLGMPLAAANTPLDSGPVFSLTPGGPSLTSATLPPPAIPDTSWRVVDATAPGNGALGFEIDNLIAATYSNPSSAPGINQILENLPNDGIVTVASQTSTATAATENSFSSLSHTMAPDGDILDEFGLNDANVLANTAVDAAVGCWLIEPASTDCTSAATDVAIASAAPAARALGPMRPATRLAVAAPARLALAEPAELPIRLSAPGLIRLTLRQHDDVSGAVKTETLPVDRLAGLSTSAPMTPMLLGQVTYTLTAVFADGAVSSQRFSATVDAPAVAPASFWGDVNGEHIYMSLAIPGAYRMFPGASFAGVPGKTDLRGHVTYALAASADAPVVSLASDGTLQALRPGTATIEARFGTVLDEIAVTVAE